MINTLAVKILLLVISLSALGGGIFYIKKLLQENAVLKATLESTTEAMANYASSVEAEINSYQKSLEVISSKYQEARTRKYNELKKLSALDLPKLLESDSSTFELNLNTAVKRMYGELEATTRSPSNPEPSQPTKAGPP